MLAMDESNPKVLSDLGIVESKTGQERSGASNVPFLLEFQSRFLERPPSAVEPMAKVTAPPILGVRRFPNASEEAAGSAYRGPPRWSGFRRGWGGDPGLGALAGVVAEGG